MKGIYVPELNEERCCHCGICCYVCPGYEVNFKQLNLEIFGKEPEDILIGNHLNCYVGHATDYNIRYNSASGGSLTALLVFALEEGLIDGALVTRMKRDKPLEPEVFIARTKNEIIEAATSKYCPVPANIALKEILDTKSGERFAVVGLPCQIHGVRKAEEVNDGLKKRVVLHMGIFCGTTKTFLGTEFQLQRMGIKKEEVKKIEYRGQGWPGSMTVKLKNNKKQLSELYLNYYDTKFCSFTPWRCTMCIDQTAELADISFGDAWLPEIKKVDKVGTSIIISRNKQSEDILRQMASKGKIELSSISIEKVIESQGGSRKKQQAKAYLNISRLLGKKVPNYDSQLLSSSFYFYLSSSILYSLSFLASKPSLWWLLGIYFTLLKYGRHFMSKLKL